MSAAWVDESEWPPMVAWTPADDAALLEFELADAGFFDADDEQWEGISMTTVHFQGGPWADQTYEATTVVGPLFAVGHQVGNHYWLDTKSDPPTYHWDGTPWEMVGEDGAQS